MAGIYAPHFSYSIFVRPQRLWVDRALHCTAPDAKENAAAADAGAADGARWPLPIEWRQQQQNTHTHMVGSEGGRGRLAKFARDRAKANVANQ